MMKCFGDLRFAPPIKPLSSNGHFDADSYGHDCPQTQSKYFAYPNATGQYARIYANFVNSLNNTQSEDCLTLNVWSKLAANDSRENLVRNAELKPVLVWIYGGRFSAGTSNTPFYRGEFMADAQDVVVVTFNFRMNIFGFPGAPELAVKNLALLDQRLAVSWVRDNIAAFGGDPSRITIAGQSSGAWAVNNWAYAFQDDPIVAGLISHSGNVFSFDSNSAGLAVSNWYNVSRTLGCGASESTLNCMRSPNITIESILAAAARVPTTGAGSRALPAFQITEDNRTVFPKAGYVSRLASGRLARVPNLQMQTDHESGFYRISALARGTVLPESSWALFEHETFTCPLAADAKGRSKLNMTSYRARYMADWDNLRLFHQPEAPYDSGAYHGSDINMVVGDTDGVSGIAPTAEEVGPSISLALRR
ncbi:putative carboxylesterase type b [Diaporthe ampelina]|uniref:Carboxylic ester hydrolase n=1 Tax=Diaporthe ampelina TaxID=1214573 RepID=A0A0G2FN58_9PEZI|nr:putative carboxylesterase type b [Diaporthe ampelina]